MIEACPSYKYSVDGSKTGILRIDVLPQYENERCLKSCLQWFWNIFTGFWSKGSFAESTRAYNRNLLKQFYFVTAMDERNISFRDYFILF